MTNRYYNVEIPEIDYEQISEDLRRQGIPEHRIFIDVERVAQMMIRQRLVREIAYCCIDDKTCSHQYCSICPRNQ